jgi:hypothetical protein
MPATSLLASEDKTSSMTPDKAVVTNIRLRAFNIGTAIRQAAGGKTGCRHDTKKP